MRITRVQNGWFLVPEHNDPGRFQPPNEMQVAVTIEQLLELVRLYAHASILQQQA